MGGIGSAQHHGDGKWQNKPFQTIAKPDLWGEKQMHGEKPTRQITMGGGGRWAGKGELKWVNEREKSQPKHEKYAKKRLIKASTCN